MHAYTVNHTTRCEKETEGYGVWHYAPIKQQQEKLNPKTCIASRNTIPNPFLAIPLQQYPAAELPSPADRRDQPSPVYYELHYKL